ncbi:MAG: hypothetical protein ACE5LV_06885, partial [Candidatus Aminicenantales bacterium]
MNMRKGRTLGILSFTACLLAGSAGLARPFTFTTAAERWRSWEKHVQMARQSPFRGLHWVALGPKKQGGRLETIDAVPGTNTIYVGFGAGNIWKTVNGGLTWFPIFEHEATFT